VKPFLYLALAVFAVLGISLFLNQEPLTATQNPMSDTLAPNRPNVILVTLDTVRADHLSLYGYERDTSPNLKRFSEQATLYTRAIATSDMTLPSHASIFTGLYAKKHRAHFDPPRLLLGRPLKDRFHTIAESLSENGYTAMGVVANHGFLSRQFGFHQGFEYYDQRVPVPFLGFTKAYYIRQGIRNILIRFFPLRYFEPVYRNAEKINEQVFSLLYRVRQKENRPIFLFVNYMDTHWPYIPPDPFDKLYPGKIERYTSAHYVSMQSQVLKLDRKVTQKERSHLVSQYDGEIVYLDAQLGNLFKKIKDLGLYDNSIIIITSDHGEAFGERGFVGHVNSVYQDQIWVPLIIKYPKISRKAVVHDLVSLIDLMPTVLDVLNFPIPSNIDGISLLKQSKDKSRPIIAESYPGDLRWNLHPRFERTECAIFSEPYKFITSTSGKRELYNLSKDPTEKEDLSVSDREISRKLEAEMNQWVNSAEFADTEAASAPKFDTDTINRLKSLGYLR
jgi:arylsulfatase A-like enzyme